MISIYAPDHELHDPPVEYINGQLVPPLESPRRANSIRATLEQAELGPILPPCSFGLEPISAIHDPRYLAYLEQAYEHWVKAGGHPAAVLPETMAVRWMTREPTNPQAAAGYYAFDLSAPIVAGTYRAARAAVDVALTAAASLLEGERTAYALCRPPGHHAGTDMCGGGCYLNNAAIAAEFLGRNAAPRHVSDAAKASLTVERAPRVAILDIDYHHCNGTQQIFYTRDDVLVVSIHADPAREYPFFSGHADERGAGAGEGYNLNIPLEAGIVNRRYLDALEQAFTAIAAFAPRFLVLSAGFDTFEGDPFSDFALTPQVYDAIGRRCAASGIPILVVQEGGYALDTLGELVVGLLRGIAATL